LLPAEIRKLSNTIWHILKIGSGNGRDLEKGMSYNEKKRVESGK